MGRPRATFAGRSRPPLLAQGVASPAGKPRWTRTTLWKLLKNPAFSGTALFGKTESVPRQPRLRPLRGHPAIPRRTTTKRPATASPQIPIPVPPVVSPELFAAVQEQLEQNRQRKLGQTRRNFLLQGLLECGCCGYAYTGRRTQKYAYYGCLGNDASRWGGQKVCHNKMIRVDCLDRAIWNDVAALLQNPSLLQQEQERRLEDPATEDQRARLATQIQQTQRAISRLIDAYQDGLLDKREWEPRLTQARTRLDRLRAEDQRLAESACQQAALRETLASLEQFATEIRRHLDQADWHTRREILRTLVQRIQIEPQQVRITYRIQLPPFASNPRILYFCCTRASGQNGELIGPRSREMPAKIAKRAPNNSPPGLAAR